MSAILTLLSPFLGGKIFGISIATIIKLLPYIQSAVEVLKSVMAQLKTANGDDDVTAGIKALAMVAKIHRMTPAEEKIWAERGTLAADQNHDFPQNTN